MRSTPKLAAGLALTLALGSAVAQPAEARYVVTATIGVAGTSRAVLVGAGDIAVCELAHDESTAKLVEGIGGTVFTAGDNGYGDGSARDFTECYDPSWGTFRTRTRPSPGNHDYHTAGAAAYFDYFGWRAGPAGRGYYAYTRGAWRIYSLNSQKISDTQVAWLKRDLAANRSRCSLAYWHHPRWSSGEHGNNPALAAFWRPLYRAGVELVVNGHDHDYERFDKRRPDGRWARKGIREIVVGTGGATLRPFTRAKPAKTAVRQATAYGVLKLVLRSASYRWRFVSLDGSFTDSGTASCHGRP